MNEKAADIPKAVFESRFKEQAACKSYEFTLQTTNSQIKILNVEKLNFTAETSSLLQKIKRLFVVKKIEL